MGTGFYRVLKIKQNGKEYYKYKINNKLIKKEFVRRDILDLQRAVENAGFLWGIIDLEEAKKIQMGMVSVFYKVDMVFKYKEDFKWL